MSSVPRAVCVFAFGADIMNVRNSYFTGREFLDSWNTLSGDFIYHYIIKKKVKSNSKKIKNVFVSVID